MVTQQGNLAAVAAERFADAVRKEVERFQALAEQTGSTPEKFFPPLGVFSGMKGDIGIGRWGFSVHIFDVKNGALYRGRAKGPFYQVPLAGLSFEPASNGGEVLFGSSGLIDRFGSNSKVWDQHRVPAEKLEDLFNRLRAQEIEPEDYLSN